MFQIDKNKCTGCGICLNVCPEGFKIKKGKVKIKNEQADCVNKAVLSCPQKAIILNNKQANEQIDRFNLRTASVQSVSRGFGRRKKRGKRRI